MAIETEAPIRITMQAAILSGSRRGEIADIIVGEPNGLFINDCENPPNFVPEKVEAVFTGFPFTGKKTTLTLAFDGSVMDATEPEFTPEERQAWDFLMDATKKAEASARSLLKLTDKRLQRSTESVSVKRRAKLNVRTEKPNLKETPIWQLQLKPQPRALQRCKPNQRRWKLSSSLANCTAKL